MPKTNYQTFRYLPAVVLILWLVFASLEAFCTRTILHHGGQKTGGISVGNKRTVNVIDAWTLERLVRPRTGNTMIDMGKGFNRARNKQADLAKKMAIAKSRNQAAVPDSDIAKEKKTTNNDDDSKQEGRDDFETLLRTTKGAIPSGDDTESAYIAPIEAGSKIKTKQVLPQTPKKPKKTKRKLDEEKDVITKSIFEAKRRHFESLIDVATSAPLGPIGAARLVPWVPPFLKKGLVVLVDPRSNSKDLRRTIRFHTSSSLSESSSDVDIAFVTADSLGETRAWLKRNEIDLESPSDSSSSGIKVQILCDPGWSFMTTYEIVGDSIDHRWSMTMLAFDTKGDLMRMERDVEPSRCGELIASTMKDLDAAN